MSDRPTKKEIAEALGITEDEARTYVIQVDALGKPGTWLLNFDAETPDRIRKKAELNSGLVRSVVIPPSRTA